MIRKIDFPVKVVNTDLFIRLGNIFPNPNSIQVFNGRFSSDLITFFSKISNISPDGTIDLFIEYVSKSRLKTLSSYVEYLLEFYGLVELNNHIYTLSINGFDKIINTISTRYLKKWNKLYETYSLEYNPIKPYTMDIKETIKEQHKGITDTDRASSGSSTDTGLEQTTLDESKSYKHAFNSTQPVPTDKENNVNTNSSSNTGSSSSSSHTIISHGRGVDEDRDLTRNGNIGNISQQELIDKEREVWKYQIIDVVFNDLDKIFTRAIYKA